MKMRVCGNNTVLDKSGDWNENICTYTATDYTNDVEYLNSPNPMTNLWNPITTVSCEHTAHNGWTIQSAFGPRKTWKVTNSNGTTLRMMKTILRLGPLWKLRRYFGVWEISDFVEQQHFLRNMTVADAMQIPIYIRSNGTFRKGLPQEYAQIRDMPILPRFSVLSVTIRSPITLWNCVAIIFSFLPVVLALVILISFFICPTSATAAASASISLAFVISELILKSIFCQKRPSTSAVSSSGMPSSHSMCAFSLLFFAYCNHIGSFIYPPLLADMTAESLCLLFPFFNPLVISILLIPVPWARYYVGDHTPSQCAWGAFGGAVVGTCTCLIRFYIFG